MAGFGSLPNMAGMAGMAGLAGQVRATPEGIEFPRVKMACAACVVYGRPTPAQSVTIVVGTPVCVEHGQALYGALVPDNMPDFSRGV